MSPGWCGIGDSASNWIQINFQNLIGVGGIVLQQTSDDGVITMIEIQFVGVGSGVWQNVGKQVNTKQFSTST